MIALLLSAAIVLLLDQTVKRLVLVQLANRHIALGRVLQLRCIDSRKALYSRGGIRLLLVVIWLAALASVLILHGSGTRFQSPISLFGLGAALGGAASNLTDILRRRAVIDFIDLGWWPAFNFADVAILIGLVVALWPMG